MEDALRPVGFVSIVIGFVLVAIGVATSMHVLPQAQFPDRWLESVGGIFMLVGFALTALAGRSGDASVLTATTPATVKPPAVGFSIKVTKSTKSIGVNNAGLISSVLSKVVDASSEAMVAGMLADLNDPAKAASIHIEGADPEQVKDALRKLLSTDKTAGSLDVTGSAETAGASTADPQPDASLDVRSGQLRELDNLHAAGVLNDEQYQAARTKLLG